MKAHSFKVWFVRIKTREVMCSVVVSTTKGSGMCNLGKEVALKEQSFKYNKRCHEVYFKHIGLTE